MLPDLLRAGEEYLKNLEMLKVQEKQRPRVGASDATPKSQRDSQVDSDRPDLGLLAHKRRKIDTLKEKEPW